jgi:benzoate-CoA ligase
VTTQNDDSGLRLYNAAEDLLGRHRGTELRDRLAIVDRDGEYTYAELESRVNKFANLLTKRGLDMEQRVLLCLEDSVDFFVCFLGAIKAGVVPVAVNMLLTSPEYAYVLADSRAKMLVVHEEVVNRFKPHVAGAAFLKDVLVSGKQAAGFEKLADALAGMSASFGVAPTRADDVAFWLYTSGTTGRPKGVMHVQTTLAQIGEHFGQGILTLKPGDVVFSPPKLFFAYGLGNSLAYPLYAGATAVLYHARPTPQAVKEITRKYPPTVFFSVPTFYAMMLNSGDLPNTERLRLCISAGEALPIRIYERWKKATGLDILDGVGASEMVVNFLTNRADDNRPGTCGKPLAAYKVRLVADNGQDAVDDEIGDLYVSGPSAAQGYWNLREETAKTFQGRWVFTRDKYTRDADGYFTHCGRSDDMLKVGGIYVAPVEVETALSSHPAVLEAAVVGAEDNDGLVKPKAIVVLKPGLAASPELEQQLIEFARDRLAAYKRPRWVTFVPSLPRTVTGKIQRHKLR